MSVDQFLLSADTTDLNYPEIRPTLDLNFARVKALDPRITFTRSSGGSYVGADGLIKYAGVNEARFDHDPVTGESLGLLVEGARTNLLLRSEEFDDGYWRKTQSSIIPNIVVAPDGTLTGDKLVENTANAGHNVSEFDLRSFDSNTSYVFSVYLKKAERTWAQVQINNLVRTAGEDRFRQRVNLETGETGSAQSEMEVKDVGNGWFKCSLFIPSSDHSGGNGVCTVFPGIGDTSVVYTGDGTSGIYIWGAQLEVGAFPTSYIPTQGSTRTRAADNASITGKNFSDFYNINEGTAFVDVYKNPSIISGIALNFSDTGGFGNNRIQMSNAGLVAYVVNGVVTLNNTSVVSTGLSRYKLLTSYKLNDIIVGANGSYVTRPDRGITPQNMTTMSIGSYPGGAGKINNSISRITYFPKRLPNAQLQALTR
jgi:hypothetical protein